MGSTLTQTVDPDRLDRVDPESAGAVTVPTTFAPAPSTGTKRPS